jgi:hypothetical protein
MAHFDLDHRLTLYGYKGTVDNFDTLLTEEWFGSHVTNFGSVEGMLHYPKQALVFCDNIRIRVNLPRLEDYEILSRLTRLRKQGRLKCFIVRLRGGPRAGEEHVCRFRTETLFFTGEYTFCGMKQNWAGMVIPEPRTKHITYKRISPTVAEYVPCDE